MRDVSICEKSGIDYVMVNGDVYVCRKCLAERIDGTTANAAFIRSIGPKLSDDSPDDDHANAPEKAPDPIQLEAVQSAPSFIPGEGEQQPPSRRSGMRR